MRTFNNGTWEVVKRIHTSVYAEYTFYIPDDAIENYFAHSMYRDTQLGSKVEFVKYRRDENSQYHYIEEQGDRLYILGMLLRWEDYISLEKWERLIKDENIETYGGELTSVDREGEYLEIYDDLSDDKNAPYLEIRPSEFLKVFRKWHEAILNKPKEILITREDDIFDIKIIP